MSAINAIGLFFATLGRSMTTLLKAATIREKVLPELIEQCKQLTDSGHTPTLRVILVGQHPPSVLYTNNKMKLAKKIGIDCEILNLQEDIQEEEFTKKLNEVNMTDSVDGLFVQLPLPKHLQHIDINHYIDPKKDVDGLHDLNQYNVLEKGFVEENLMPCTPMGIIDLLKFNNIDIEGKNVVVLGRSMIVGKPMALMCLGENATTTICHSRSKNTKELTKKADIIVSAIGKANFVDSSFLSSDIKPVIIDVGMNQDENGKLCGDVNFEDIKDKVQAITPVPGGVGPMTVLSLMKNVIKAAKNRR